MDTKIEFLDDSSKVSRTSSAVKVFESSEFGKVRMVIIEDEPWFVGKDVADILGYYNSRDALIKHVDSEDKMITQISDLQEKSLDHMKGSKITIINRRGVSSLIFKSEKLSMDKKIYLAGIFDIPVSYFSRKEIEFKDELVDFFKSMGLSIESQYGVGRYRVDFYIPYFNLVIEYDEKEHRLYDPNLEKKREEFILNKLNCKMLRLSDRNSNAYNLGLITKELFINKQDFKVKSCY